MKKNKETLSDKGIFNINNREMVFIDSAIEYFLEECSKDYRIIFDRKMGKNIKFTKKEMDELQDKIKKESET